MFWKSFCIACSYKCLSSFLAGEWNTDLLNAISIDFTISCSVDINTDVYVCVCDEKCDILPHKQFNKRQRNILIEFLIGTFYLPSFDHCGNEKYIINYKNKEKYVVQSKFIYRVEINAQHDFERASIHAHRK